jgi:hypothetical protein
MYIAWFETSQGEIHNELGVSWGYWFLLGGAWFVVVATPVAVFTGTLLAVLGRIARRGAAQ